MRQPRFCGVFSRARSSDHARTTTTDRSAHTPHPFSAAPSPAERSCPETYPVTGGRPAFVFTVKANPKDFIYFLTIALCWSGTIAGWVIFGVKGYANWRQGDAAPTSGDADRQRQALKTSLIVAHAGFILLFTIFTCLLLRQAFFIHACYFGRHRVTSRPVSTTGFLPPWISPRLPLYIDAIGGRGQGTGDVEDEQIVGKSLPKYGDNRNSQLLLRSESRGGRPTSLERRDVNDEITVMVIEQEQVGLHRPANGASNRQAIQDADVADASLLGSTEKAIYTR